jgi:hypothetical protein
VSLSPRLRQFVHAGARITIIWVGFTNLPEFVPVYGELRLLPDTFYSIELFVRHFVPERNESLRFMLEENVVWNGKTRRWEYIRGRQERFHIVDTRGTQGSSLVVQQS